MAETSQQSIAYVKAKKFAVRIVNLCKYVRMQKREWDITHQLIKSGTSIGANLAEAIHAMSKKDFLAKVYISLKECHETRYWLEVLNETNYLSESEFNSIVGDCDELVALLTATTKTTSNNLRKGMMNFLLLFS